jgi:hypothetical protein
MSVWGQRWGQGLVGPDDLDPKLLVWGMRRQIDPAEVPAQGFVIRFDFRGIPKSNRSPRYWWLVLLYEGLARLCRTCGRARQRGNHPARRDTRNHESASPARASRRTKTQELQIFGVPIRQRCCRVAARAFVLIDPLRLRMGEAEVTYRF